MNPIDREKLMRLGFKLIMLDLFRERIKYREKGMKGWEVMENFPTKKEAKEYYIWLLRNNDNIIGVEE